jgi:hypothetical protein
MASRLFLLFVLVCLKSAAQTYLPFPQANASWTNELALKTPFINPNGGPIIYMYVPDDWNYFCVSGEDTLIQSVTYTRISYCGGEIPVYKGAIRDEAGKVFYVPGDDTLEYLLYDFTAEAGDSIFGMYVEGWFGGGSAMNDYPFVVEYVDTVVINGVPRRRLWSAEAGSGSFLIEGIGNSYGLFMEYWINVSDYSVELVCMNSNDTILYGNNAGATGDCPRNLGVATHEQPQIKMFPNPVTSHFSVVFPGNSELWTFSLVNAYGQSITLPVSTNGNTAEVDLSDLPSGIYFLHAAGNQQNFTQKLVKE